MLNEQLRYSLSNITPENNFTKDSFLKYQETDESISQLEVTMNGFISQFTNLKESTETSIRVLNGQIALKVSKDKLCSEISATSDAITFKTGYLVIDTNNFKLYKDGTASFSGTINGGSININHYTGTSVYKLYANIRERGCQWNADCKYSNGIW